MQYNKIIAVSGLPGLFELLSSKNDGAVVRSLDDKSAKFVSSRIHDFSHLEAIEIYTVKDNVNLADVFLAMQDSKTAMPDAKDNVEVKKYFEKIFPDMDFERVYVSDMKKMVKWYEVLKSNKIEIKLTEAPKEEEQEEAPKKTAAKAKTKAAEKEEPVEEKKKAAPKKAAAEKEKAAPKKTAAPKKAAAKKKAK